MKIFRKFAPGIILAVIILVIVFAVWKLGWDYSAVGSRHPTVVSGEITLPPKLGRGEDPQSVRMTLNLPPQKTESSQFLTIIVTAFFTLLGSSIVLIYNVFATSSSRKFEWARHLWDKHETGYLELRNIISRTVDPTLIQGKLDSMQDELFLPKDLQLKLARLVESLRHPSDDDRKEALVQEFLTEFDSFLREPWKFV